MRSLLFCLLAVLAITSVPAQPLANRLDSVVNAYGQLKKFSGSVLVAQRGKILLEKGYGYKNIATKTPADPNTLYQYGSVTKQFTAALILYLQEKGKLNINDNVSRFFPQLPWADSITIFNLLTHTSGIYNYTENGDFMKTEAVKPAMRDAMLALFKNHPLQFKPGTQFRYSNSGYSLLGYIAEKAGGAPYETLLRKAILQPAGMATAGFDFAHNASPDRATGYDAIDSDNPAPSGIVDSSVAFAAGSLYGSVKDLYAWHMALQKGAILSKASWTKIYTPFLANYALGWSMDSLFGHKMAAHDGGIFGFTSSFKRFPDDDVVIIALSNNSSPITGELANNLAAVLFGQPVQWPKARTAITLPEEKLKPLVGEYDLAGSMQIVISLENGHLRAQPKGQPAGDLLAEEENKFFIPSEEFFISFDKDSSGAVTGFTLHQSGHEMKAKKVK